MDILIIDQCLDCFCLKEVGAIRLIQALSKGERRRSSGPSFLATAGLMTIVLAILSSSLLIAVVPSEPSSAEGPRSSIVAQPFDEVPPSVHILTPEAGQVLTNLIVHVAWEAEDLGSGLNHTFLRFDSGNWLNVDGLISFDADLLQGGPHNVTVVVFDIAGNQARDQVDFVMEVAPDAPQSLNATAGASGIAISWAVPYDGGAPIISYKIFRRSAMDSSAASPIATSPLAAYFDVGAIAGTKYYYEVEASNTRGDSPSSSEVNATLADGPRPPDAPTSLTATPGIGFVSLSWSLPSNQGGSEVVSYKVYRTSVRGANPTMPIATLSHSQQYYIDASLISGEYYYKVSAISFAEGPRSNESNATVSGIAPGSPGTIVSMSLIEEGSDIRLSWQVPTSGASPIVRYLIYRSLTPHDPVFLNNSASTIYVDGDVTSGQTYHYWIVAENGQGQGPLSAMMTGTANSQVIGISSDVALAIVLVTLAVGMAALVIWIRRRK
jgi:fibronectin type 3 domain-containing protein